MSVVNLMLGDCLERMKEIPDGSVDMILADPPYGTTQCKWDSVIDLKLMWGQLKRIVKPNGAIVLTASQPFTSVLISSNLKEFKYSWVWDKGNATNFPQAKKRPLKYHEDVCVFCAGQSKYYPIKWVGKPNHVQSKKGARNVVEDKGGVAYTGITDTSGLKYPRSILRIEKHPSQVGLHPTQKPVALMEYLVNTYTNKGETVLDFTMGSGTTGVACVNTSRNFIGIEMDENYFDIASKRIADARLTMEETA